VADEKTNPTPKVEGARTDTMHSTPDVPDRSKMDADDLKEEREATAAPSNTGSVGSERPHKSIIKSEKSGTLVEDIPSLDEPGPDEPGATNPLSEGPEDPLALQPGEPLDTDTRKPFDKRQGGTARKSSAKSSTSRSSTSKSSTSKASTKDK
jgi:hypothetical protein